ncbi:MAG: retropepsin-like aspartic protease [Candidatus Dormiibacterota bacterium]
MSKSYWAIWDTGATNTAVTSDVVTALGIAPTGVAKTKTANGERVCNAYLVDVNLRNGVIFTNIPVTEATLEGANVLIGMDIISQGDFAITNVDGKTTMSYRVPSIAEVDYVAEAPDGFLPENREERRQLERTGHLAPPAPTSAKRPTRPRR